MPIYEYQCPKCGRVFEEWAKASDAHKEEACPNCGTPAPRIMSRTSFVLKGDGWYVSDYGYRKGITEDGGSGAEPPAKAEPITPATQGEKALAKSEAKSEAKAETKADKTESKDTASAAKAKPATDAKPSPKAGAETS